MRGLVRIECVRDLECLDRRLRMIEAKPVDVTERVPQRDEDRIVLWNALDHAPVRLLEVFRIASNELAQRVERIEGTLARRRPQRIFAQHLVERGLVAVERAWLIL